MGRHPAGTAVGVGAFLLVAMALGLASLAGTAGDVLPHETALGTGTTAPATWEAYDAAVARAWEAKFAGRFEEGLEESRRALALLLALPDVPAYKVHGTRADVRIHEEIVALPPQEQTQIHAADDLAHPIRQALRRREFAFAESLATVQLTIRQRLLGPRAYDIAESQRFLGRCLGHATRWSAADSLFLMATAIYDDYLGPRHPNLATILADRAANAHAAGRRTDAESFLREGLGLLREHGWERHPLYPIYAYSLTDLSGVLRGQGQLARAETAAREAIALLEGEVDWQNRIAAAHSALGEALRAQGRYAEALASFETTRDLRSRLHGPDDPDVARAHLDLATTLRALRRVDEAEAELRAALAIRESVYGRQSELTAHVRLALASLLAETARQAEAEAVFTEALTVLGAEPAALHRWGDFLRTRGRLEDAADAHRRALHEYRRREDPRFRRELAIHLRALAADLYAAGRYAEARALLEEAASHFETVRLAAGDRFERATFEASPYPLLAATELALGDSVGAWNAFERSLGRALLDILASGERPVPMDIADRRRQLLRSLEEAESRWELLRSPEDRQDLVRAQAAWVSFQTELRERFPRPGEASLDYAKLRLHLDPAEAVVAWLDLDIEGIPPRAWTCVVRHDRLHWSPHPASDDPQAWADAESALVALRTALREDRWSALGAPPDWSQALARVSADRWAPALPALRSARDVTVIGTGALAGVPVDALLAGPYGPHVVDRWTTSTAPSASVRIWLADRSPHDRRREALFAVADPAFQESPLDELPWRPPVTLEPLPRGPRQRWIRLPASRQEVRAISSYFEHIDLLVGSEATETSLATCLAEGRLARADVLHFATHAFSDDRDPDRSALVLAADRDVESPAQAASTLAGHGVAHRTDPTRDGLVTAREISVGWELGAELVVLSSCQTALGHEIRGEGFVGLTHSFLAAGARNVLASLWSVDDQATRLLMEHFYHSWLVEGHPGPEALRSAKRAVRDTRVDGDHPYAHPRHWAAFVWVGPGH